MCSYIIIFSVLLMSCNSPNSNSSIEQNKEKYKIDSLFKHNNNTTSNLVDTSGFLSNCQYLIEHAMLGDLQGVQSTKDSISSFYFSPCYDDCKESYEVIFVHKDKKLRLATEFEALNQDFYQGCKDNFQKFDCFAFVCPMRDPDKQKDIHAMNIDFPINVRGYSRISGDKWRLVGNVHVKTFEEYTRFQFETINGIR